MSATFDMKTYLTLKSETQLKNFLIKINGPRAVLTGSKPILVTRLELAANGLGSHELLEVCLFMSSKLPIVTLSCRCFLVWRELGGIGSEQQLELSGPRRLALWWSKGGLAWRPPTLLQVVPLIEDF